MQISCTRQKISFSPIGENQEK